jgi:folate-dependent tRNA-U54 methylase TrmFO/GidA
MLGNSFKFCYFLSMTNEEILRELSALPPAARREATDFIAFLQARYGKKDENRIDADLTDENFVGMWKDREDLPDAAAWVRELRQNE